MIDTIELILTIIFATLNPPTQTQVGKASTFWPYEPGLNNGKFACGGDWEDETLPVCAHRTLPCGSWILVENLETDDWAWCKVMDRGPYGKLDGNGKWFNSALERKAAKKEDRKPRKGRYRGILDMGPSVSSAVGSDGMLEVKIWWWKDKELNATLDKLLYKSER